MGVPSTRPTLFPPFDVAQFARESEDRIVAALPALEEASIDTAQSEVRLSIAPRVSDEEWAAGVEGVATVVMPPDQLRRLPLDHRAGYMLSQMDGRTDLETLVTLAPMPRDEALNLVRVLFECGVVDFCGTSVRR